MSVAREEDSSNLLFLVINQCLHECVSDTLKLFSRHKFRNKRDGLYESLS